MSASRAERLGEHIRTEAGEILTRRVHDPGVGFVTITRVRVSADLQVARIYYTALGDQAALRTTERALVRVAPFVRHQLAERLRLRRVPEMSFVFDKSIAHQARVEELLQEIHASQSRATPDDSSPDDPDD
jgi:ribosome-binding factor A